MSAFQQALQISAFFWGHTFGFNYSGNKSYVCTHSLVTQHIAYEMLMLNQEEHICILADPLV
jgi:hypothetical protein